jgi:hypothetical protein
MTAHQVRSYGPPVSTHHRTPEYEIRVAGHLPPRWSAWFDGLTVAPSDDGSTVLRGPVVDQAALHGLLQKLRDLGLPLLSLTRVPPDLSPPSAPSDPTSPSPVQPARDPHQGDQP